MDIYKVALLLATPPVFAVVGQFICSKLWDNSASESEEAPKKKRVKAVDKTVDKLVNEYSSRPLDEEFDERNVTANPVARERRRQAAAVQEVQPALATADEFAPPAGFDFKALRDM